MTNIILDLHKITKAFGEGHAQVKALNGVDLEVKKGEIVLIMGPSGSGKTTLLSIGGGILKATSGKVILNGSDIGGMGEDILTKKRLSEVGFIFQQFLLLASLTAKENVQVVAEFAGNGGNAVEKSEEILKRLGLADRMNDIPANLSLVSIEPNSFFLTAKKFYVVKVPVVVRTTGSVTPDLQLTSVVVTPEEIEVWVPEETPAPTEILTEELDVTPFPESIIIPVKMISPEGIRFVDKNIMVSAALTIEKTDTATQ